jgi:hypothetical protein
VPVAAHYALADGSGWKVGVSENNFVAVTHFHQKLEEVGGKDWGDGFQHGVDRAAPALCRGRADV